jgi:hypothetical protein
MTALVGLEAGVSNRSRPGYDALWGWFGLSYASWLPLPRVLMHEMPDDWQARMAVLLEEFDAAFKNVPQYEVQIQLKRNGRFVPMPDWIAYRHPDRETIEGFK